MNLLSSIEVSDLTGLTHGAICKKHRLGKFPRPESKANSSRGAPTFYSEDKVIKWKKVMDNEALRLHKAGVGDIAIAKKLGTSSAWIRKLILRLNFKKASKNEGFKLFLNISSNIRSKLNGE